MPYNYFNLFLSIIKLCSVTYVKDCTTANAYLWQIKHITSTKTMKNFLGYVINALKKRKKKIIYMN